MPRSIQVTPFAVARISAIRTWYEENYGEEMADDFYWTLIQKFDLLEKFNELGPDVPHWPAVRRLVITGRFDYYVFYRLTETEVIVLTVTKDAEPAVEES